MKIPLTDYYVQSAEFYDLLSEPHWASRRESVLAALSPLADTAIEVLDIGAGTGCCVQLIAQALPKARIYAVEPSASMRIGLITRVLLDPDLRARVTICAEALQQASIPESLDLAVVCGCIGYFDREERAELWRRLAVSLKPQGAVLADVMPPDRPQDSPATRISSAEVGRDRYDIWLEGHPGRGDIMDWQMRFEVWRGDQIVRQFSTQREWHTFGIDQLMAEATELGFQATRLEDSPVPAAMLRLRA